MADEEQCVLALLENGTPADVEDACGWTPFLKAGLI